MCRRAYLLAAQASEWFGQTSARMVRAILANDDDTVPGRGSDVRSSGHRPCPGEQALPRRNTLLSFPLRDLLLFCKPLSAHASVHPRGHRTCLAHTGVYGVAV